LEVLPGTELAEYETGDEFYERATAFFAAVKWDVLASLLFKPSEWHTL
jgi:hypothetical protein